MASRGQYLLKISGRTRPNQPDEKLTELRANFLTLFGKPPGKGTGARSRAPGDEWPIGFVLQGYNVCQWHFSQLYQDKPYAPITEADRERDRGLKSPDESTIEFLAEVHHTLNGSLYYNRRAMLDEVQWFYHYRDYAWHRDLVHSLNELNAKFASVLLDRVWFRDWKWYCGNGGC